MICLKLALDMPQSKKRCCQSRLGDGLGIIGNSSLQLALLSPHFLKIIFTYLRGSVCGHKQGEGQERERISGRLQLPAERRGLISPP